MDEPLPDYLDRLPVKLKCTVARYLDELSHRKTLVLVKKAWAEVVAPVL
jgi:hypothetical protein